MVLQIKNLVRMKNETAALQSTYRRSEMVVGMINKCAGKLDEIKYNQKLLGFSDGIEEEFEVFIRDQI